MTATRVVPHDLVAQESLLGAMMLSTEAIRSALMQVSAADFYGPAHAAIFEAISGLYTRGVDVDATTVVAELRAAGTLDLAGGVVAVISLSTPASSHAPHYAHLVAKYAIRRQLLAAGGDIVELGYDLSIDEGDMVDAARARLDGVEMIAETMTHRSVTVDTLAEMGDDPYDWVLPGFFDREDRTIFISPEGHGKTTLLRQIAVCISQGICPFTLRQRVPLRAHVFDLENPRRIFRRAMRDLRDRAIADSKPGYDGDRLWAYHQPAGLDIRSRQGFSELERELAASQPDVVCMGPLYKLFVKRPGESDEDAASDVTRRLDDLRTRFSFALFLEHHAPKSQGLFREMTPFGSSIWLRWPEFGISLQSEKKDDRTVLEWGHWRGPRDVRPWPSRISRDSIWPWSSSWDKGIPTDWQLGLGEDPGRS